jgi:N-acetylglucosaminyldiphosphoundecaprenol N-acetyl-beta-D-mannosaminyltransferase
MVQFPVSIVDLPRADELTNRSSAICRVPKPPQARFPLPPGATIRDQPEFADPTLTLPPPINLLGLPIVPWHHYEVIQVIDWLVQRGTPSYFITANLHYARLSASVEALQSVNSQAAFIVADGMPLVWMSRLLGRPLPERVTGADLVWSMCELAADKGYRIFLLGGAPGVAETAGQRLQARFSGLAIAGVAAPNLDKMSADDEARLIAQIRKAKADILFAALGQPKGELWLARNLTSTGVAVAVQIGAALDFVAGRVRRAPRIIQQLGMEWAYRIFQEPQRLFPRYWADGWFFLRQLLRLRRNR